MKKRLFIIIVLAFCLIASLLGVEDSFATATFDWHTGILYISVVDVPGHGKYKVTLTLRDATTLEFELTDFIITSQFSSSSATYDFQTGTVNIPYLDVKYGSDVTEKHYDVVGTYKAGSDPMIFSFLWTLAAGPQGPRGQRGLPDHTHSTYESDITEIQNTITDLQERIEFLESIANYKYVFVTSEPYTGNLGGLSGADSKCQALADDAGLPGTYMAWLSDSSSSPMTRFSSHSEGPYVLVDGSKVADNWADLIADYEIQNPINMTENGISDPTVVDKVWTNTEPDGTIRSTSTYSNCENWTYDTYEPSEPDHWGGVGDTSETGYRWTAGVITPCYNSKRLYCFQQ